MNNLEKVLEQNYSEFHRQIIGQMKGFNIAKISFGNSLRETQEDKREPFRYLIEKDGQLSKYDGTKEEFLEVNISDISENTITLEKENPYDEGIIKKDVHFEGWFPINSKEFRIRIKDTSYYDVDYKPNSKFWESDCEIRDLPGSYKVDRYTIIANCLRNFMPLESMQYKVGYSGTKYGINETKFDEVAEYFDKHNVLYIPKRDRITLKGSHNEHKEMVEKAFRKIIPTF